MTILLQNKRDPRPLTLGGRPLRSSHHNSRSTRDILLVALTQGPANSTPGSASVELIPTRGWLDHNHRLDHTSLTDVLLEKVLITAPREAHLIPTTHRDSITTIRGTLSLSRQGPQEGTSLIGGVITAPNLGDTPEEARGNHFATPGALRDP